MKSLVELASTPLLREQWELLLKSEVFQAVLAGVEQMFPPIMPPPEACNGAFPSILLGSQLAQQIILRAIRTPEMWNIAGPAKKQNIQAMRTALKGMGMPDSMLADDKLEALFAEHNVELGND